MVSEGPNVKQWRATITCRHRHTSDNLLSVFFDGWGPRRRQRGRQTWQFGRANVATQLNRTPRQRTDKRRPVLHKSSQKIFRIRIKSLHQSPQRICKPWTHAQFTFDQTLHSDKKEENISERHSRGRSYSDILAQQTSSAMLKTPVMMASK